MTSKLCLLLLLTYPLFLPAQIHQDEFIYPDPSLKLMLIESIQMPGEGLIGQPLSSSDKRYQAILSEMEFPFHQQINRVNQCIRNLTTNTDGPNILLLSGNEGGFPRQGISIHYPDGKRMDYPDLHFADLVLDEQRIAQGDLSIYAHEMGHVMMNMILTDYWDRFPAPGSPKQHVSMGVTDYLTAFYEGWGVHFQRMAYDQVNRYQSTFHSKYQPNRTISPAWHSNLDERLRILNVESTNYIYEKLLPAGIDPDTLSIQEQILFEHTSPVFDPSRIKTGQQILSCEGAIASLFYFINSNETLQKNYQPIDFYTPFLIKRPDKDIQPSDLFSPFENVLLKSVFVWTTMNQVDSPGIPIIDFIRSWCLTFPEDRKELISTFVFVTKGKTIENELAALTENINYFGQTGDIVRFRELAAKWVSHYKQLVEAAIQNPDILDQNVGQEIWMTHPDIRIRRTLWMAEPTAPLSINLNTASLFELQAFTTKENAQRLIEKRRMNGYLTQEDRSF